MPNLPKSLGRTTRSLGAYLKWRLKQLARLCLWATLGLLAALLVFHIVENIRGHLAWSRLEKELRAKGEPLTIEELVPPPVSDDQNFASSEFFEGIFDYKLVPDEDHPTLIRAEFATGQDWPMFILGDKETDLLLGGLHPGDWSDNEAFADSITTQDFTELLRTVYSIVHPTATRTTASTPTQRRFEAAYGMLNSDRENTPSPEEAYPDREYTLEEKLLMIGQALDSVSAELDRFALTAKKPYSRFPVHHEEGIHALTPHTRPLFIISRCLSKRASFRLIMGDLEGAYSDLGALDRLRFVLSREPSAGFGQRSAIHRTLFTGIIWEGIQKHAWTPTQLGSIIEMLEADDWIAEFLHAQRCERAHALRALDDAAHGDVYIGMSCTDYQNQLTRMLIRSLPKGWKLLSKRDVALYYQTALIKVADLNTGTIQADAPEATALIEQLVGSRSPRTYLLTSNVLPEIILGWGFQDGGLADAHKRSISQAMETQTTSLLASTACALELHFLEHGNYPGSLEALIPEHLDELPLDPVDREPLRYLRIDDDSYKLYSIGPDQKDDGGRFRQGWREKGGEDWIWAVGVADATRD